jgi:hypothetical protein
MVFRTIITYPLSRGRVALGTSCAYPSLTGSPTLLPALRPRQIALKRSRHFSLKMTFTVSKGASYNVSVLGTHGVDL